MCIRDSDTNAFHSGSYSPAGKIEDGWGIDVNTGAITYTLAEENGASLRASGWLCAPGFRGGGSWNVPGRPRADSRNTGPKRLYYKELR